MNKKIGLTLSIGIILLITGGICYWLWTRSPIYSLKQLYRAINNHDREKVEKYLDIDTFVTDVTNQIIDKTTSESEETLTAGVVTTAASGIVQMFMPAIKEKILSSIETITLNTDSDTKSDSNIKIETMTLAKKEGKLATISVVIRNNQNEEMTFQIKMRNKDSYWQVIGINNIGEILSS